MDRLALAVIALALVLGGAGVARGRAALERRAQADQIETRVAAARQDEHRLRTIPPDARRLPSIPSTLLALDRSRLRVSTPLQVRVQLDPAGARKDSAAWRPLAGERVKISMLTGPSPAAAIEWLRLALEHHALLMTQILWDGRMATVHAVALGS
jgi:hypothetical protein